MPDDAQSMPLCDTCKHWGDGRVAWTDEERATVDSGTCLLLSDRNSDASAAVVGQASFYTEASFGCTEHAPAARPSEDHTP